MKSLMLKTSTILFFGAMFFGSCSSSGSDSNTIDPQVNNGNGGPVTPPSSAAWLIPTSCVADGGPGKDGIPSIDNPQFTTNPNDNSLSFLTNDDLLVAGIKVGNEIKAYPYSIMNWHEITNDIVGNKALAIIYCPLTGTVLAWDRNVNGSVTEFGVSGLLFNNNIIPYDRNSNSNWSQMLLKSVNGSLKGTEITTHPMLETSFGTWKAMFPGSKILTAVTGFNRPYGVYPYINGAGQDYRESPWLLFQNCTTDNRRPVKERVLGVTAANGNTKVYTFDNFPGSNITAIEDNFEGEDYVIVGSKGKNLIIAFNRKQPDGRMLSFDAVQGELPVILKDNEGTKWTVFGEPADGGSLARLSSPISYMGYFFAFGAFFQSLEIK